MLFWQWRVDRMPLPGWLLGFGWNSHGPFPKRFPRWLASFSEVDSSGPCMAMHNRLSSLECSVTIVYVSQVLHTWTEKARVFDTEFSGWRARWALPASQDKRCLGDWKDSPENTVPKCPKDIDDFWTETFFGRFSHTWKGDGSTTVVWMGEGDFDGNGRESHHSKQPEMQFLTIFSPQNMDCLKDTSICTCS